MFSISALELLLTVVLAVAALGFYCRGMAGTRWLIAATGCFALASILTPADIASTLLFAIAFLVCFYFGTKQSMRHASPSV